MDLHLADRRLILRGSAVVLTLAVIVLLFATAQTAFADGPGGVPDTPNGLEASAVHAGIVDIKWNEVEGAESYEVRVMPSGTWISLPGEGMEIAHYGAGAIVRNLPHEGRYYFSVRARNESGASEWSAFLFVQATGTPSQWSGVPEPVNAAATGTPSIAGRLSVAETLTADTSGIADANGLERVRFRHQWASSDGTTDTDIEGATSASYTLVSADEGRTIKVRVSFTDRGGYEEGPLTGVATPEVGPEPEVPGAPRNPSVALAENGELTLSWEAPDSDGGAKVTGYRVEWKSDDQDYSPPRQAVVDSLSHRITGLTNGSDYRLRVLAVNRKGEGPASDEVTGSPQDTTPPEFLATDVRGTKITLTYNKTLDADSVPTGEAFGVTVNDDPRQVSDVSVEGSLVKLDLASAVRWNDTATVSYTPPSDLQASRIKDTWGNSAGSFSEALTPPLEVPGPPRNLSARGENGELELSWDAPDSNGGSQVRGYRVQWKPGYEDYDPTRQTEVEHPSYTATGLADGVEYTLRVMAWNEIGEGPASAEVTASPQDTVDPELLTVAIHYATLRLHFSEALAAGSAPSEAAFNVVVSGAAQQVTNVSVEGRTLVLTLASSASSSDTVALSYTAPADPVAARIEDLSGNPAASFGETAAVWSDIPGPPMNLRAYPGESGVLTALWEAPSSNGSSQVTEYRLQWKSRDEDYDPSREAVVTGGREHSITGLANGVEHALRVFAINSAGHGPSSLEVARKPRESNGPLYRYIEEKVVERYEGGSPWLRRTWEYMQSDEFELRVSSEGEYPFQGAAWEVCWLVLSGGSDNELAKCRGRNMILQEPYTRSIGLILHEMGHVYTYTNAIHSYPGPEAVAWLYFDHPQFCAPSELYADALVGTVYSAAGETNRHWWGYWDACSHYPNAERAPTPQAALAEMQLVLNGEYPEWLDDTYADEQGNLDLVGLWDQVQRFGRFRDVVSYGLRNEFGGYCSNYWVRLDLMLGYHDQLNPWRAGGCLPSTPRDVNVVAGDGQVIVKWKEPLQEGALPISHYRIQWKELGADYYSPYDLHRPNELAREGTISRLSNGVTYKVRVAAAHPNLNVGVQRSGIGAWVELTVTPRVNSRATGPPAISGITHTGQTLTVDTSGIVDADGLTNVSYSYQWIRSDGNIDTDIAGETASTYTLVSADEGKTIKVRVSFTDDTDNQETLTSAATAAVAARPNSPATGAPTIGGTAQVGETSTADTSGIADEDGLTNVTFNYQWIRSDNGTDADIAGQTDSTYTMVSADRGKAIKVKVSFTDDADHAETLTSQATGVVTRKPPQAPEMDGISIHDGVLRVSGGRLEFSDSTVPAADVDSYISSFKVQWKSGSQEYDATRQAVVIPEAVTANVTHYAFMPSHDITGLTNDVEYTVRVIATNPGGDGPPSQEQTATPGAKSEELWQFIEDKIVEEHEASYPWLRQTWNYLQNNDIPLIVWNSSADPNTVETYYDDSSGIQATYVRSLNFPVSIVDEAEATKKETILGHLAYMYTMTNGVSSSPASLGIAHVYFRSLGMTSVGCWDGKLYLDVVVSLTVHDSLSGASDWNSCMERSEDATALAVVRSALSGQTPAWFEDTYHDSDGNPDLEQLWEDVRLVGRDVVAYQFRNSFGGYCDTAPGWAIRISRSLSRVLADAGLDTLVNPWRDGGCTPTAPVALTATLEEDGSASVSWEAPESNGGSLLSGYRIEWQAVNAEEGTTPQTKEVSYDTYSDEPRPTEVSETIDGLTDGVDYTVRVLAYNPNGGGTAGEVTVGGTKPNASASGAPTIDGTPQVGQTLTAGTSDISDGDGLTNVSYSYQWIANDGNRDADIEDGTDSTYKPSVGDVGKTIKVRVSFTDDADNDETLTSEATVAVAATVPSAPQSLTVTSGSQTRELDVSWQAPSSNGGFAVTGYKVQWKESTDRWDTAAEVSEATETGTTHTITGLTGGVEYSVRVIASNDVGDGPASTEVKGTPAGGVSEQTVEPENSAPTGLPSISGTPQVDQTLTADTSNIDDEDGLTNVSYRYQWGAGGSDIEGATGSTYTLTYSEQGQTIQVRVTFTDDRNSIESRISNATTAVAAAPNRQATGKPTISGTPQVGQTLTADTSNISDLDGITNPTFAYQWRGGGLTIIGATGSTYTLTARDQGKTITVRVRFIDDRNSIESRISNATTAVAAAPNRQATGKPTIGGTPQVGQTLTADTSNISDLDGITNPTFAYQWRGGGLTIIGATGSTYTLTASDQGKTITVRVRFIDDRNSIESRISNATTAVAAAPNRQATGKPTISGTPQVGETLTADTANIADEDGLTNVSYSYQWIAGGSEISGATGSTHTLTASEQGQTIQVRVTFTDDANNEDTLTSEATAEVTAAPVPLTVSVTASAPATHDGSSEFTFEIEFSKEVKLSYVSLKNHAFNVTGGSVERAQRTDKPSNISWLITVKPQGNGDVIIELPTTTDCDADGAVCAKDDSGRKLSNSLSFTVSGPGG